MTAWWCLSCCRMLLASITQDPWGKGMRVAFFVHRFPAVSETFVIQQIVGLLDLGHEVDIYSERRPHHGVPQHHLVKTYGLLERTTYLDEEMPPESGEWSMPVWPLSGETWIPGAEESIRNIDRALRAAPVLSHCLDSVPRL